MTRNWKRKLIGGLSFTSMLFVFQACYGTPHDTGQDVYIHGLVKSKATGLPVKGVKVSLADKVQFDYTTEDGKFSFYTEIANDYTIRFQDLDSIQNGSYTNKYTLVKNINDQVYLEIALDKK